MTSSTLDIGVLLFPYYQLLDATGPIDYLNNHTKFMLTELKSPLVDKAPVINWHYISPTSTLDPIHATSGPIQIPTCTYANCPRLDYLLIPGPNVPTTLPGGCTEFVQTRFKEIKGLLLVCTGSIAIADTGVLDGLHVCANKYALKNLGEQGLLRKEVKWVGDRRWRVDGKVWSAAGVTAGIDLAAEFARVHFDREIVEFMKDVAEYEPKPDQPDVFSKILEGVQL